MASYWEQSVCHSTSLLTEETDTESTVLPYKDLSIFG